MSFTALQKIEKAILEHSVSLLKGAGWSIVGVHDGEERIKTDCLETVIEHVFSVSESRVYFKKDQEICSVVFILGNGGWDVIADHSYPNEHHEFVKIMEQVQVYAENFLASEAENT